MFLCQDDWTTLDNQNTEKQQKTSQGPSRHSPLIFKDNKQKGTFEQLQFILVNDFLFPLLKVNLYIFEWFPRVLAIPQRDIFHPVVFILLLSSPRSELGCSNNPNCQICGSENILSALIFPSSVCHTQIGLRGLRDQFRSSRTIHCERFEDSRSNILRGNKAVSI